MLFRAMSSVWKPGDTVVSGSRCSCVVKSQYWVSAAARKTGLYPATAVLGKKGNPHIAAEYSPQLINIAWHLLSSWETESCLFFKWCPIATCRQCWTEDAVLERLCLTWAAAPESASYRKKNGNLKLTEQMKARKLCKHHTNKAAFCKLLSVQSERIRAEPSLQGMTAPQSSILLDDFWEDFPSNQALLQTVVSDLLPP